jgi:hypothetical protein
VWSVSWLLWLLLIGPVILEDRMTTKLPRISEKLITRTTSGCSFGCTDCYVLSACDATSQWHFRHTCQYH